MTSHRCIHCGHQGRIDCRTASFARKALRARGWRWADSKNNDLICATCASTPSVDTAPVEWVTHHLEAHGHLLVRANTLATAREMATEALGHSPVSLPGAAQLRLIRSGYWRAVMCQCPHHAGNAAHPRWHYMPADPDEPDAYPGAEFRLALDAAASTSPRRAAA